VPHFAETHAVELRSPGGGRLLYGADCRAGEEIVAAALGVDVLVAEATLTKREDPTVPVAERGHMSAAEAGEVASVAEVGELILTHFSDLVDPQRLLEEAATAYAGPIRLAAEGMRVTLE
ncbi:MAG: MBL fold metallo-hydrolase, partial [Solirubrobacterales bacterium]